MVPMKRLTLALATAIPLFAQIDPRIGVSPLVREDLFAGILANDMTRFAQGEATLDQLDKERPEKRGTVRAWQGAAALYRAVLAYESGDAQQGGRFYEKAQALLDEALRLAPNDLSVLSLGAFGNGLFADRLPADKRAASWAKAYDFYRKLSAQQMPGFDKLPLHDKGELLAGLAMSAQRTGREAEYLQCLDKMIEVMADTPYARTARTWKDRPETASKTSLMCKTCHDPGRLDAKRASLANAPRP
jgi:tetratricopeptide (TPR) repeat protein